MYHLSQGKKKSGLCRYDYVWRVIKFYIYFAGELKLCYLSKVYLITMQTFQMAILLLFESSPSLQCSEIQSTLQLNWEQFLKNCVTLVECKILTSSVKVNILFIFVLNLTVPT